MLFGLLRLLGLLALDERLHRADQHVRVAAFQARHALHRAVGRQIGGEAHQQFLAEIGVRDFAPAELHHGLHAIAFLQKADGVVLLEIVVVVVRVGAELQFLDLHHVLLLAGIVLLLLQIVLVVAEVHCLGHRRHCGGRNQHQVEPQVLRLAQRGGGRHHLGGAVRKYRTDFTNANRLVHVLSAILPARRKVSAWIHLLYVCREIRKPQG